MSTAEHYNRSDYNTVVADNIRAELARERWTQRKAATALGVTPNWMQRRLSGSTPLDPNDIALFASFLNVPIATLFEERENGPTRRISVPKVGATAKVTRLDEYRHASVAQWIEHQFPVLRAARSIRAGGTIEHLATVTPILVGA